jgi:hypothetical protein
VTSCTQSYPTGQTYDQPLLLCITNHCASQCYGATSNPCAAFPYEATNDFGNGCGTNLPGGDPTRLCQCNGQTTTTSVVCQNGCHASAAGQVDYCIGSDPCVSNPYNGVACGANLSPNANQATLYNCSGQRTVSTTVCANGCVAAPPGSADHCK